MSTFNISKIVESIPARGIDFEYCAVKQTQSKSFHLSNPTNQMLSFDISTDESAQCNFKVEPTSGKLLFLFQISNLRRPAARPEEGDHHYVHA